MVSYFAIKEFGNKCKFYRPKSQELLSVGLVALVCAWSIWVISFGLCQVIFRGKISTQFTCWALFFAFPSLELFFQCPTNRKMLWQRVLGYFQIWSKSIMLVVIKRIARNPHVSETTIRKVKHKIQNWLCWLAKQETEYHHQPSKKTNKNFWLENGRVTE
jgi:hypothetical protein